MLLWDLSFSVSVEESVQCRFLRWADFLKVGFFIACWVQAAQTGVLATLIYSASNCRHMTNAGILLRKHVQLDRVIYDLIQVAAHGLIKILAASYTVGSCTHYRFLHLLFRRTPWTNVDRFYIAWRMWIPYSSHHSYVLNTKSIRHRPPNR